MPRALMPFASRLLRRF